MIMNCYEYKYGFNGLNEGGRGSDDAWLAGGEGGGEGYEGGTRYLDEGEVGLID